MGLVMATHNGPFHADDVLAYALVRTFVDAEATVVRSRDPEVLATADLVADVGGVFDPATRRFDHHQHSYDGPLSSAGMVLDWLQAEGRVEPELAARLREALVDYVDAVDNGREPPRPGVPTFPAMVDALGKTADTLADFDAAFLRAGAIALAYVEGLVAGWRRTVEAREAVRDAMARAEQQGVAVLFLDRWLPWKEAYFELGGAQHPTDFVVFVALDGSWRIVAIPPELGSFAQKRPLPAAWAGLTDDALTAVTGIEGSVFCHKNRFIAVFRTREGAIEALLRHGLLTREPA